jgi:hypothetical protein
MLLPKKFEAEIQIKLLKNETPNDMFYLNFEHVKSIDKRDSFYIKVKDYVQTEAKRQNTLLSANQLNLTIQDIKNSLRIVPDRDFTSIRVTCEEKELVDLIASVVSEAYYNEGLQVKKEIFKPELEYLNRQLELKSRFLDDTLYQLNQLKGLSKKIYFNEILRLENSATFTMQKITEVQLEILNSNDQLKYVNLGIEDFNNQSIKENTKSLGYLLITIFLLEIFYFTFLVIKYLKKNKILD